MPGVTAKLRVYSISGRLVAEVEGRAGTYLVWDGRDNSGQRVPSGVYFYGLKAGSLVQRGKWVLIR